MKDTSCYTNSYGKEEWEKALGPNVDCSWEPEAIVDSLSEFMCIYEWIASNKTTETTGLLA